MTREIIETIINIEKKSEDIISQAKIFAQNIDIQTTEEIQKLQEELKQETKQINEQSKSDIEKKSEKEQAKITQKVSDKLEELLKTVKRNNQEVKKQIITKILS